MWGSRGLALLAISTTLYTQPFRPMVFVGKSMEPTYKNRELVLIKRTDGEYRRGDVVVVRVPGGTIVKRIAYVPGDRILEVKGPEGWIEVLTHPTFQNRNVKNTRYKVVPEGQLYVVGDNMGHSTDSRDFGAIESGQVTHELVNWRRPTQSWLETLYGANPYAPYLADAAADRTTW
jgi:signal peptidase I